MSDEISRIIKDAASGQWHADRDSETDARIKRLETVVAGIPLPSDITKAVRMTLGDEADPTKPGLAAVADVTGTIAEEHIGIRTEQIKLAERIDKLERRHPIWPAIWGATSIQSGGGGSGGGGGGGQGAVKIEATPDPTARTGWRAVSWNAIAAEWPTLRLTRDTTIDTAGWRVNVVNNGHPMIGPLQAEREIDRKDRDELRKAYTTITNAENRLCEVFGITGYDTADETLHSLIDRVQTMKQHLDSETAKSQELSREVARFREHSKLIEKLHRERIGQCNTMQQQLTKIEAACTDQTIQITEMRGVVRRLVDEREEAIAKVRELETKLGEAQHRGATAETEHRRASRAFDELASKHNALQERHASVQRALDDAIKQRERIEAAHWQGVEQYRAEHPDQNTTLPPVRSELVKWLLEQREQLAEQLAVADADRVPLRMDLDEASGKLERLAPIVELLPTWAERATPGMLSYEHALHDAVLAWQAAERAADESPDGAG